MLHLGQLFRWSDYAQPLANDQSVLGSNPAFANFAFCLFLSSKPVTEIESPVNLASEKNW